jgi:hypothetical protein
MDGTEQAALVAAGEVTPVELLDAAIERIERDDKAINAVVLRWFDDAREVAASADLPDGPFRGVPFLLKNLFASMAGTPLTNGNKALAAAPPVSKIDTTLVSRYRAAGLVIAGRTNSPELGSLRSPNRRPTARRVTRGTSTTRRADRAAERRPPSPPAWCRSPTHPTAADRSASRPRAAGWWGSRSARGGSRWVRCEPSTASASSTV